MKCRFGKLVENRDRMLDLTGFMVSENLKTEKNNNN